MRKKLLITASLLTLPFFFTSIAYAVPTTVTTGSAGPQGPIGKTGSQGLQGQTGPAGPKGDKGATGAIGPQGIQGPIGAKGAAGAQGPTGAIGKTGATGLKGIQGPIGLTGPAGAKGATGVQGPAGATVQHGIQGPKGDKGDQGIAGPQGALSTPCTQADLLGSWTVIVNNTKAGDIEICTMIIGINGNLNNTSCTLLPNNTQGTGSGTGTVDKTCTASFVLNTSSGENINAAARLSSVGKDTLLGFYNSSLGYYGTFNATKHPVGSGLPITTTVYHIGDKGPAGGIVFFLSDNNGLHGLEAAPADSYSGWGCWDYGGANNAITHTTVATTSTAIGTGAANTVAIIAACGSGERISISNPINAAATAIAYVLNGFNDWYLPSKDELNLLYQQRNIVGGFFSNVYYSSSSEYDNLYVWGQYFFPTSSQDFSWKEMKKQVRPIRSF